jgi:hypothetical protein
MKTRSGFHYSNEPSNHEKKLLNILEKYRWVKSNNYSGPDYSNYIRVATKNRDSNIIEISNFDSIMEELYNLKEKNNHINETFLTSCIKTSKSKHWACGWVEELFLSVNSPALFLEYVIEYFDCIEIYPIYNDDKYYQYRDKFIEDNWEIDEEFYISFIREKLFPHIKNNENWDSFEKKNYNIFREAYGDMIRDNEEDINWNYGLEYIKTYSLV